MSALAGLGTPLARMRSDLCGLDIDLNADFDASAYSYPCLSSAPLSRHTADTDDEIFATLLPANAEIVCLLTNLYGDTYVCLPRLDGVVTLCKPAYAAAALIGNDSVCHGFLYPDKNSVTRIGLFDVSKMNGNSTRELAPVDRHIALHTRLREARCAGTADLLKYHWSGYEMSCMRACLDRNDMFDIRGVVRVPVVLNSEAAPLVRVLPGIHTRK